MDYISNTKDYSEHVTSIYQSVNNTKSSMFNYGYLHIRLISKPIQELIAGGLCSKYSIISQVYDQGFKYGLADCYK